MTSNSRIKRMTTAQLKRREAELEAALDDLKTTDERQADALLAERDEVVDEYDPTVDTSAQQARMLLESDD